MRGIAADIFLDDDPELLGDDRNIWIRRHSPEIMIGSDRISRSAIPVRKFQCERDNYDRPGIYFLLVDDRIVYVGQSIGVTGRIFTHAKERKFDTVSAIVGVPKWAQTVYEYAYIRTWQPAWNAENRRGYPDDSLMRVARGLDKRFVLSRREYVPEMVTPTR